MNVYSIPLRPIFKKPWKSLISGVFCCLVERKNVVFNRFKPVQSGKLASKLASGIGIKNRDETGEKTERIREFGALISLKYFSENTPE